MFKFGQTSLERLEELHPDLKLVFTEVIKLTPIDFGITEGLRSVERAEQLLAEGKSKVGAKSLHCQGKAVDIVCYNGGKVTWELEFYEAVAGVVGEVCEILDVKIRWGGSWVAGDFKLNRKMSFIDAVHFEIIE